jgi:hypothetical protein
VSQQSRINADRVAAEAARASAAAAAERKRQDAHDSNVRARRLASVVNAKIPQVLTLLAAHDYRVPSEAGGESPQQIAWQESRFPALGGLLGWRTVTKAAWMIGHTEPTIYGGEGLPQTRPILLVSDGRIRVGSSGKPQRPDGLAATILARALEGLDELENRLGLHEPGAAPH